MKAIFALSADPITYGHIDSITRAAGMFNELVVGIGVNPEKKYLFTLEEREEMARHSLAHLPNVTVASFPGLLVDYAKEQCIDLIVRGIRNSPDSDYEQLLQQINDTQQKGVDTIIFPARQSLLHISSSAAKELQKNQGLLHTFVPLYVKQCLEAKMSGQYFVGVTGEIGVGKSYVARALAQECTARGITAHNIELDEIGHQILTDAAEPLYVRIRAQIADKFKVPLVDGKLNRKALGEIVFNDTNALRELNTMMYEPMMLKLRRDFFGKRGLLLLNAALIAEADIAHIPNNNVVLVTADETVQRSRLLGRGLTPAQIERRFASQYRTAEKRNYLEAAIEKTGHGKLWTIDNSGDSSTQRSAVLDDIIGTLRVK